MAIEYNFFCLNKLNKEELNKFYSSSFVKNTLIDPLYSKLSQEFYLSYFQSHWIDVSVAVVFEDNIIGYILAYFNDGQISYFNLPIYSCINEKLCDVIEMHKALFNFFLCNITSLPASKILVDNNFFNYSSLESPVNDRELQIAYIDLICSLDEIKRNIRKSYKSLINWGEKNFRFVIIDKENPDKELFNEFMLFHHHVSGRITRSEDTWAIQYNMIENSEAFALIAVYKDRIIGASLIVHTIYEAYYGVGVYDRELMQSGLPVSHSMLFKAISIAKDLNIQRFILGEISHSNSIKEQNIAKFKSGFTKTVINRSYHTLDIHLI
jgi:hypothetical protein